MADNNTDMNEDTVPPVEEENDNASLDEQENDNAPLDEQENDEVPFNENDDASLDEKQLVENAENAQPVANLAIENQNMASNQSVGSLVR